MSNQFIGLSMLVTLSSPPGAQLRGIVSSIEPGKSLTLRDVTSPASGKYVPEFTINAAEIVELVEAASENARPPPAAVVAQMKKFEDPAILSVGKRPPVATKSSTPTPTQWKSAQPMERVDSGRTATGREERVVSSMDRVPTVDVMEPVQNARMGNGGEALGHHMAGLELEADAEISQDIPFHTAAKRTRKRRGKKDTLEPNATPVKETTKSKGWRQTPLLEPNPSFQPFSTLKRQRGRRGVVDENGWATEDATDVQDMGDFDFAGSLAKFDKHTIFNQIQAEDSIADEDRLVAHNRLPKAKPGTGGGKNLHYTENVLDVPNGTPKMKNDAWKSEASDIEERSRTSPREGGSSRLSRRAESKLATSRRSPSRKGSANAATPLSRTLSMPVSSSKPSFYLVPTDRRCEPISPLQMLNLENIADHELGLTEDMMTENAGRGIAEVVSSALNTGGRGLTHGKNNSISNVVVYAGNNKSGLRAVAAGRHLRNQGLNVVVCILGLEREPEHLDGLRRQLKVFRSFGGKVLTKAELLEYVKSLDTSVDLIIDGLLGLTISFEELRTGDQATAYELIEWANRSKASVLAIDIPTGIDPTTGKISIIDGRQLYVHARYVVAMGAPKKGLLEAMALGEGVVEDGVACVNVNGKAKGNEWQLFVADIGMGAAVWKKAGTRVRRGVEFEGSWVMGMRFQGGVE